MATPTSSTPRRLGHVPGLDGLRGVAVLIVMVSHFNLMIPRPDITGLPVLDDLMGGGYLGVDLFFVLSGFLITSLLLDEERGRGTVRFGDFYARRALRLLPALYFMLLCHAAYTLVTELDWGDEVASIQAAVLYYSNWQLVFRIETVATGTNHLWSLAVEEQFYLIWPLVLTALLGLRQSARTVSLILGVAIAAIAVHRLLLWEGGDEWLTLFVRTDTRADSLLVGALLASLWVRRVTPTRGIDPAAWVALAVAVVYMTAVDASDAFVYQGGSTLFAVAAAVMLLAVVDGAWAPGRLLASAPLRAVGRVSYGLYLWHFPVFHVVARYGDELPEAVRVSVGVTVATLATLLSWFCLERPMQDLRRRFRNTARRPDPAPTAVRPDQTGMFPT